MFHDDVFVRSATKCLPNLDLPFLVFCSVNLWGAGGLSKGEIEEKINPFSGLPDLLLGCPSANCLAHTNDMLFGYVFTGRPNWYKTAGIEVSRNVYFTFHTGYK